MKKHHWPGGATIVYVPLGSPICSCIIIHCTFSSLVLLYSKQCRKNDALPKFNDRCLQEIASSPTDVILAQNYSTLVTYLDNIVNLSCFINNVPPPCKHPFYRFMLAYLSIAQMAYWHNWFPLSGFDISVYLSVFYVSAKRNVAGGIMFSGCSLVCVSVCASRTLLAQYREKCWIYFNQSFRIGALWDKDERFNFWSQMVKVQGLVGSRCWNVHFLALLTQYLVKYWTEFHRTLLMHFDTKMKASTFGVERPKFKVTSGSNMPEMYFWPRYYNILKITGRNFMRRRLLVYLRPKVTFQLLKVWGQSQGHNKVTWNIRDHVSPKRLEVSQWHLKSRSRSGLREGQGQGRFKVKYYSELLWRAEACTSTLNSFTRRHFV